MRGSNPPWGSKRRKGSGGTRRPRDRGGSTAAPGTTEAGSTRHSACLAGLGDPSGLATPACPLQRSDTHDTTRHDTRATLVGHERWKIGLLSEEYLKPLAVEMNEVSDEGMRLTLLNAELPPNCLALKVLQ